MPISSSRIEILADNTPARLSFAADYERLREMNGFAGSKKTPKTARGRRTRDKLLQAAEFEFGEKGFHEASVSGITHRAGAALGSFYNYFESKEEIFRALVYYMSRRIRGYIAERVADAPDRLTAERRGLVAFMEFVREHPGIYRIISEAEFVANEAFVEHYTEFARAYRENLEAAGQRNDIRDGDYDVWSWAIMGMAVFMGMRFADWSDTRPPGEVADAVADLIGRGIAKAPGGD